MEKAEAEGTERGIENPLDGRGAGICLDEKQGKETVGVPGSTEGIRDLVEYIAKALVDYPEQVKVSEVQEENTLVIEFTVAKEDFGKVVGKQGLTVQAIRTILNNESMKIRKRPILEIIEENILLPCTQDCLLGTAAREDKGGYFQSGRKTNADLRVSLRSLQAHFFGHTDPSRG